MSKPSTKSIVIINQYSQLPDGPGGTRHYTLAHCLTEMKIECTLILGSAELNTGRQRYSGWRPWKKLVVDGVNVVVIKVLPIVGNGPLRILGMIQFSLLSFFYLCLTPISPNSVIYASTPQPFACFAACIYSKLSKKRFILEIRDLWPESLFSLDLMKRNSLAGKMLSLLDTFLVNQAEMVVTLLSRASEYYAGRVRSGKKFLYIPNGVTKHGHSGAIPFAGQPIKKSDLPAVSCDNKPFTFMYLGALGYANAVHVIAESALFLSRQIDSSMFAIKIIGAGPERHLVGKFISDNKLANVFLLPPVPKSEILAAVQDASCFVFHLRPANVFNYGISPNKLIDYMLFGRPVIFCGGSWPNPLQDAGVLIAANPMDPKSIADAMLALIDTPLEKRIALSLKARDYVLRYHDFAFLSDKLCSNLWPKSPGS